MTEDDQILQCRDEPATDKTRRPLEWWDAADRYFMDCLKAHAIALPDDDLPAPDAHVVTKLSKRTCP